MSIKRSLSGVFAFIWLVTLSFQAFGGDVYESSAVKYNTNMAKFNNTLSADTEWVKGMDYRVLERPVIVRDIASEDEPEEDKTWSRNPASYGPRRPVHYQKFVPAPYLQK